MGKFLTLTALLSACLTCSYGQAASDSISMKKVFGGYQYYIGDERLTMGQLVNFMESNEQAFEKIKSAQTNHTITSILAGVGGFMVGWPIGASLGGGDPNWTLAGIGAGLIVVSIPISIKSNKQAKQAVEIYNEGLRATSFWDKNELRFSVTDNGLGLTLKF